MASLLLNKALLIFLFLFLAFNVMAQGPLEREMSIHADRRPVRDVLQLVENKAGCFFSYESTLLNADSIVSVHANRTNLKELFNLLFQKRFDLIENGNNVVITLRLPGLTILNPDITGSGQSWSFSGFVVDDRTGDRIINASVYEKRLLQAALTDDHGYFKMRFRTADDYLIRLTLSKLHYRDTTINMLATVPVSARIAEDRKLYSDEEKNIEKTGLGAFLTSSRQRMQSLNIRGFFAYSPFQVSLAPGLSTHGLLSPQIVNKFSLNVAGGYTAGVNGFEIGGLFNMNKKDSKYLQLSGVFNLTGGKMTGLQISVVHNMVLDTATGVQVAGFINHSEAVVRGVQIAGLHNYAKMLKGLQIGLVNMADTSSGASIGLINIIRNGHYRVSVSANDAMNTNLAFQSGTSAFYSVIKAGMNINPSEKLYAFGMGFGREFFPEKKVSLLAEADFMLANASGTWDDLWGRIETSLSLKLGSGVELFGGPVFNYYLHSQSFAIPGYKNLGHAPSFEESDRIYYDKPSGWNPRHNRAWIGWQGGLAFRSSFKPAIRPASSLPDKNMDWLLGIGISGGISFDYPYGLASGADIRLMRHLGGNIDAMLTTGVIHLDDQSKPMNESYSFYANGSEYQLIMKYTDFLAVPVKGGVRALLGRTFYVAGEVGVGFCRGGWYLENESEIPKDIRNSVLGRPHNRSFVYSPSFGFALQNGLDLAFKFEDFVKYPSAKQFAVRLAYNFRIR